MMVTTGAYCMIPYKFKGCWHANRLECGTAVTSEQCQYQRSCNINYIDGMTQAACQYLAYSPRCHAIINRTGNVLLY